MKLKIKASLVKIKKFKYRIKKKITMKIWTQYGDQVFFQSQLN